MSEQPLMRIGDLARLTGVSVKAIRLYEDLGLVRTAGRTVSNYRQFPPEAIACIRVIKRGRELGLSLKEMAVLARMHRKNSESDEQLITSLLDKAAELGGRIERLQRMRREVVAVCEKHRQLIRRGGSFEQYGRLLQAQAREEFRRSQGHHAGSSGARDAPRLRGRAR